MNNFKLVLTTVPSKEVAEKLSNALIQQQLAACVNSIKIENSAYFWDGKINNDSEYLLMIKTFETKVEEIERVFSTIHPYDTPLVMQLSPESVNNTYIKWMTECLKQKK